ncbi:ephrin-B1-like isoform X2 [Pollicipes pollicipes]|uniref:ephrin-B1-like isoform X2 n=1 Tax=Pollicipes pollicipes TaxID=41117 RepID=UPI0018856832|nr:ephrin-B1-like isoform X2 [Pollicipes pollicipes]
MARIWDWLLALLGVTFLCASASATKNYYIHWNTSNPIFQISNTDHIIDVNKGNNLFEYDQVTIICPSYNEWTREEDTEKYIIYNVSKEEYDTCRITNPNPRIIAVCDKPYKLMFFTITFRSFTPQPGGLEFRPGQDYFFISTSARGDMLRRIGGRCSTHNMKVVFKVCCNETEQNHIVDHGTGALPGPGPQQPLPADEAASTATPDWLSARTTAVSTARPTTRHSYKGTHDLYGLHVPSINVKATTKKTDEFDKNKHPNDGVAKKGGLKSAAGSLDSCAALAVSIGLLLLRLVPG